MMTYGCGVSYGSQWLMCDRFEKPHKENVLRAALFSNFGRCMPGIGHSFKIFLLSRLKGVKLASGRVATGRLLLLVLHESESC